MMLTFVLQAAKPVTHEQAPAWVYLVVLGFVAALLALYVWLGRLRTAGKHPIPTHMSDRAGNSLLEMQAMLEPSKRHVIEAKKRERAEQDDAGDSTPPSQ